MLRRRKSILFKIIEFKIIEFLKSQKVTFKTQLGKGSQNSVFGSCRGLPARIEKVFPFLNTKNKPRQALTFRKGLFPTKKVHIVSE
jgi:hypothetical protein